MADLTEILTDLNDECAALDRLVAGLPPDGWRRETPAPGWTIAHQINHLAWTDRVARLSATDPDRLAPLLATRDLTRAIEEAAADGIDDPGAVLERWRTERSAMAAALIATPRGARLPWFATTMTPASMATARLMETWAHGLDVAQALGTARLPTARLRHVAFLGVRTMRHGFVVHGRPAPTEPVYVELTGPDGNTWAYGPADAANRVTGPVEDFCLLVTQRAHRDDLELTATGPVADEWLDVAQVFAGPPGQGRKPHRTRA